MLAAIIDRLTVRLWAWRLRGLRCTRCEAFVDRINVYADGKRITAHCPACDQWDDWRRG